jgi:hypothetical protein
MKSNRMRLSQPDLGIKELFSRRVHFQTDGASVCIENMPAPLPVAKVSPDQLIEDILVSTLRRVQSTASPEVAAAAARYIALLSEGAL